MTEDQQLNMVKIEGWAIQHIENSSAKIQLAAVKNCGESIRFIDNPSEEIQIAAIKNDWVCVLAINNLTEEAAKIAIQQNRHALSYIKHKLTPSKVVRTLHSFMWEL